MKHKAFPVRISALRRKKLRLLRSINYHKRKLQSITSVCKTAITLRDQILNDIKSMEVRSGDKIAKTGLLRNVIGAVTSRLNEGHSVHGVLISQSDLGTFDGKTQRNVKRLNILGVPVAIIDRDVLMQGKFIVSSSPPRYRSIKNIDDFVEDEDGERECAL